MTLVSEFPKLLFFVFIKAEQRPSDIAQFKCRTNINGNKPRGTVDGDNAQLGGFLELENCWRRRTLGLSIHDYVS